MQEGTPDARTLNTPIDICKAWTALEALSPQTFRTPEDLVRDSRTELVRIDRGPLPWSGDGEFVPPRKRLFYQILLGTVDMEAAVTALLTRYHDGRIERPAARGAAILAAVTVDRFGCTAKGSAVVISSFGWAVPRALAGDLETLGDWRFIEQDLIERLHERMLPKDSANQALPLDQAAIQEAYDWLVAELQLPHELLRGPTYVLRIYETGPGEDPPELPLLNSFYLTDLALARSQFERNSASQNLRLYFGAEPPASRRDLLHDNAALSNAVRPGSMPLARWPGKNRSPLVLLQQAAVNIAHTELESGGILGVNGPPGTGKTTLLRDIAAALISDRARAMCEFDDPETAFVSSGEKLRAGNGFLQLYRLDERLRGYEMLVASSNNRAVENVTAELPTLAAIAVDAIDLRYFQSVSDELLGRDTWGLFAAVLGNRSNRYRFKQVFWWDEDYGMATYLAAAAGSRKLIEFIDPQTRARDTRPAHVVTREHPPSGRQEALRRWQSCRTTFLAAVARSEKVLGELDAIYVLVQEVDRLRVAEEQARAEFNSLQNEPPGLIERVLRTRQRKLTAAHERIEAAITAQRQAQESIAAARRALGGYFIDDATFELPHAERHQLSPWIDEVGQRTRDAVFVAAMALHKAFIDAAAKPLRHNLGALMDLFGSGKLIGADREERIPDLWRTLFLVVPVVSTTFASVGRMLGALPPESLGWLLIDEAGQALPQAAVGALMRAKRAVVVGDPMQIEPIVTLPETLTETICRRFSVDPMRFNAPCASAQTLADSASAYYTEFVTRLGDRAVGVPLLVHRRCGQPMFSISNNIAYEGLMVHAKAPPASTETPSIRRVLGDSRWIDVRGTADDKWSPEEGSAVVELLWQLARAGAPADLYIISPFVLVQMHLRQLIQTSGVLKGWVADPRDWLKERVGTVHVTQGREAEGVILVLGAPQIDQAGARGWAGGRPNLLNVAVTRAKEVIYVVGNRQLWRAAGVFSELDAQLDPE